MKKFMSVIRNILQALLFCVVIPLALILHNVLNLVSSVLVIAHHLFVGYPLLAMCYCIVYFSQLEGLDEKEYQWAIEIIEIYQE